MKDFRKLGLQTGCVMTREGIDPPYPVSIHGVEFYEFQNEPLGEPVPTLPTSVQRVSSEVTRDDEGEEEDPVARRTKPNRVPKQSDCCNKMRILMKSIP